MALDLDEPEAGASWMPTFAAWALPGGRSTVARARALLRDGLAGRGVHGEALAEGELMGCELVTNAVRHACPPFELRLRLAEPGAVVCEIVDGRTALPPLPATCPASGVPELTLADIDPAEAGALEGGRGLDMVAHLSGGHLGARVTRTCTVAPPAPAKAVWFTLTGRTAAGA